MKVNIIRTCFNLDSRNDDHAYLEHGDHPIFIDSWVTICLNRVGTG